MRLNTLTGTEPEELGDAVVVEGVEGTSERVVVEVRWEDARAEEALRRVAEERLHLSRELHDVIGHHLAVIRQGFGQRPPVQPGRAGQVEVGAARLDRHAPQLFRVALSLTRNRDDAAVDAFPLFPDEGRRRVTT